MKSVVGWVAWYTDRRTFYSDAVSWRDLPKQGVLAVVTFFEDGTREIISGVRRYFRADGTEQEFYKGTLQAEGMLLKTYRCTKEDIKEGIWDDDATMYRVLKEASEVQSWQSILHMKPQPPR